VSYNQNKAIEERKLAEEEVKKELALIRNEACVMLTDARYKKIKSDYEKAEKAIINLILSCMEEDPIKFKAKITEWTIELRIIRSLINKPVEYAEEKPKPSFGFMNKFLHTYKKDLENVV
jgi:hypothetical protein